MKYLYRSSLPSLLALFFLLMSCAPKYGAHFSPSKLKHNITELESYEVKPLLAEEATVADAQLEHRAKASGASSVISDKSPAAAVKEKLSFKEQRKILKQLRKELKGMSQAERQAFKQQLMYQFKQQQALTLAEDDQRDRRGGETNIDFLLLVIITILLPPVGVYLHQGGPTTKFLISLLLTLLAFISPFLWTIGIVYGLLVIFDVL